MAEEIHHIVPAAENPTLFYTRSNLLPLCQRCHTRTRTETLPRAFLSQVQEGKPWAGREWPQFGEEDADGEGVVCSL